MTDRVVSWTVRALSEWKNKLLSVNDWKDGAMRCGAMRVVKGVVGAVWRRTSRFGEQRRNTMVVGKVERKKKKR